MYTSTRITVTDEGLTVNNESFRLIFLNDVSAGTVRFAWSDVSAVFVFKRDLWVRDLVCMVFELKNSENVEIDWETEGWKEVLTNLPSVLPGIMDSRKWCGKVLVPDFAMSLMQIYPVKTST
jgi:hypothetical protein